MMVNDMRWQDVAETVGKVAPALGGAFAGPGGYAIGSGIAKLLNVEDSPEAVAAALQSDPTAVAKLRELENEMARARLDADVDRQRMINETMRVESQQEGIFKSGWRPALGWVFTGSLGSLALAMAWTIINDPTMVGDSEFSGMLVWLFVTMGAALGINVKKRSDDKNGGASQGFLGNILTSRKR
jgi:hypothetical protein